MEISRFFPKDVFRAFSEQEHADQFLSGLLRFGSIYFYKRQKDWRGDKTEGLSHVVAESGNHYAMFAKTTPYICSLSKSRKAAERLEDVKYIVHIDNLRALTERIDAALSSHPNRYWGQLDCGHVQYDKSDRQLSEISSIELARLASFQKPESYSKEDEFRLVILARSGAVFGDFLTLNIGSVRDIARLTSTS